VIAVPTADQQRRDPRAAARRSTAARLSTCAACVCGASIQTSRGSAGSRTHPIVPSGITRRASCGDRSTDGRTPGTLEWERVPQDFVSPSCVARPSCRLPLRRPFWREQCDAHRRALLVEHQFQSAHAAGVDMSQARRYVASPNQLVADWRIARGHFHSIAAEHLTPVVRGSEHARSRRRITRSAVGLVEGD
jgi:hypothetical protein